MKRHANVKAADRNGKTALDLTQDETIRAALEAGLQEQEKRQGADKQAKKVRIPHRLFRTSVLRLLASTCIHFLVYAGRGCLCWPIASRPSPV